MISRVITHVLMVMRIYRLNLASHNSVALNRHRQESPGMSSRHVSRIGIRWKCDTALESGDTPLSNDVSHDNVHICDGEEVQVEVGVAKFRGVALSPP